MEDNITLSKKLLRKKIQEKIPQLDYSTVNFKSEIIQNILLTLKVFKKANKIGLYYPKENEASTIKIINTLLSQNKSVYLPKIKKGNLEFKAIKTFNNLEKGSFSIFEPKASCPSISPSKLDLLIVPCIAIDIQGNRIGRGKGFYDKFLTRYRNIKTICLAHELQVLNTIPHEKHDQKIDLIITEKRILFPDKKHFCKFLNGKLLANKILVQLKEKIKNKNIKATLAVILVGNNPASQSYIKIKHEKCKEIGIGFKLIKFKEKSSEKEILTKIKELNKNSNVTGILVQLPLPKHLNTSKIIASIIPKKDADGLTKINQTNFLKGKKHFPCCTPQGILQLLKANKIFLKNKNIVLVGYGNLVGKPLALILKKQNIKFNVCDEKTTNIKEKTQKADILISATGVPHLINEDHIKKNVIIIDAGSANLAEKIVGDVNFDKVISKASQITLMPGGVGPMTVAILLENVINAYEWEKP